MKKDTPHIKETFISSDVCIRGTIETKHSLVIEGKLLGNIKAENQLYIKEGATIQGDVICENLYLEGEIDGSAEVRSKSILYKDSSISQGLITSKLNINSKAKIKGGLTLKKN